MLPFIDIYEFGVKSIVCFLPFCNLQLNFLKYFCDTMINIWTSFCFNLILNWINNNKMKQWQSKSMYCLCYGKVDDPNHRFSEMNNFREKFDGRFFVATPFFIIFFWHENPSIPRIVARWEKVGLAKPLMISCRLRFALFCSKNKNEESLFFQTRHSLCSSFAN